MSLRCGCYREGDATVFGEIHECGKEPDAPKPTKAQTSFGRLVPSWRFVVPETSEGAQPGIRVISCTPPPVEGVAADNLQQELGRLERPYERVLGEDELHD
jgi:hypothetical protein